jgi:hypothetical protein
LELSNPASSKSVDEILTRFGETPETAQKLAEDCANAEKVVGIHGVSVTARTPKWPAPAAKRSDVEKHFLVHNTGSDPLHRTIQLPKPVTQEVADLFNRLFGRI